MFEEEIREGSAWLDIEKPGWAMEIDVASLDLNSCSQCVLGQLFGDYFTIVQNRDDHLWAVNHGFLVSNERCNGIVYMPDEKDPWRILRDEWIDFIKERLDAGIVI